MIVISTPSRPTGVGVGVEYFPDKRAAQALLAHHHLLTWNRNPPKPRACVVPNAMPHAMNYATSSPLESATTRTWEYKAHTPGVQTRVRLIPDWICDLVCLSQTVHFCIFRGGLVALQVEGCHRYILAVQWILLWNIQLDNLPINKWDPRTLANVTHLNAIYAVLSGSRQIRYRSAW